MGNESSTPPGLRPYSDRAARPSAGPNGKFNRLISTRLYLCFLHKHVLTDVNVGVSNGYRTCRDRVVEEDYQLDLFGHHFGRGTAQAKGKTNSLDLVHS